jgi:hypothetical protein
MYEPAELTEREETKWTEATDSDHNEGTEPTETNEEEFTAAKSVEAVRHDRAVFSVRLR